VGKKKIKPEKYLGLSKWLTTHARTQVNTSAQVEQAAHSREKRHAQMAGWLHAPGQSQAWDDNASDSSDDDNHRIVDRADLGASDTEPLSFIAREQYQVGRTHLAIHTTDSWGSTALSKQAGPEAQPGSFADWAVTQLAYSSDEAPPCLEVTLGQGWHVLRTGIVVAGIAPTTDGGIESTVSDSSCST